MIEAAGRYEASFFANLGDIQPNADTIPRFLEMFRGEGFLPNTFQEIAPGAGRPVQRLRLSSSDDEWVIDFESNRISFQKNATKPRGSNLGSPEEFARQVVEFSRRIVNAFPKNGTRLALVTKGLMAEMPEEKLLDIYHALFRPIQFYAENPPVEWRSQLVSRVEVEITGQNEKVNVLTGLHRFSGQLLDFDGVMPIEGIDVTFDINTHVANTEARFNIGSIQEFYQEALELRAGLVAQLKEVIHADG